MIRILAIAAMLSVSACSRQESGSTSANETANSAEAPAAEVEVPSLQGDWQVTAIDGKPVGATTARFTAGKAVIAAGCLRRAWAYTQDRNIVSFTTDPSGSANCGGGPSGDQEAAFYALENANMAIFGKDGTEANLSGTGGNLTLQRR